MHLVKVRQFIVVGETKAKGQPNILMSARITKTNKKTRIFNKDKNLSKYRCTLTKTKSDAYHFIGRLGTSFQSVDICKHAQEKTCQ